MINQDPERSAAAAGRLGSVLSGTVGEPFVDADDIADVAVATPLDPSHIGRINELTGPRLIIFSDMAAEISAVTGRPFTFQSLPVHYYVAALVSAGLGEGDASGLAHLCEVALDVRNAHLESATRTCLPGNDETSKPSPRMCLSRVPITDDRLMTKGSAAAALDPPPPAGLASGPHPRRVARRWS